MISIQHLYKSYPGKAVLRDIQLDVRRGSILGLLGPNGAGKTTLISILTGLIEKDAGAIAIGGLDLDRERGRIQCRCSYVPQNLAFYNRLSARENLEYFGSLWGLKGKPLKERMAFCIDAGSLAAFVEKRVDTFSGGMKRRLNLAIGLLNEPELLYLDEPTVGVDAQSRNYILETIRRINREKGTTVIYTSHYMDEIEQVADDIAVIDGGRIVLHDSKEALMSRAAAVAIRLATPTEAVAGLLGKRDGLAVEGDCIRIARDERFNENMAYAFTVLGDQGAQVKDVLFGERNLEALFLELTSSRLRDDEE
ncbi:MAG: ABC transporter ATP-binding protein [Deltaproteobacteria bacterium]|nr:ABC transporter ATP-binding protein [Deltaproteobacteria bacterium]